MSSGTARSGRRESGTAGMAVVDMRTCLGQVADRRLARRGFAPRAAGRVRNGREVLRARAASPVL